jgi:hypothetical protein
MFSRVGTVPALKHDAMKTKGGGGSFCAFVFVILDDHVTLPSPREKVLCANLKKGSFDPIADLDMVTTMILAPSGDRILVDQCVPTYTTD